MQEMRTTTCSVCTNYYSNVATRSRRELSPTGQAFCNVTRVCLLLTVVNVAFAAACGAWIAALFVGSSVVTWIVTLAWWWACLPGFCTMRHETVLAPNRPDDVVVRI